MSAVGILSIAVGLRIIVSRGLLVLAPGASEPSGLATVLFIFCPVHGRLACFVNC